MIAWTISVFVGLCLFVENVEGGECCKAHDNFLLKSNDEMWCDDYCCYDLAHYYCCDNIVLQAASWEREDICSDYFSENVWVPILISIGCVAAIIGCCFCCYRCCCRSGERIGVVMAPGAANPSVTVVNTTNTTSYQPPPVMGAQTGGGNTMVDPRHAGYNQGEKPN